MSRNKAMSLDATLEIMSDPQFLTEILRNRRALDRGEGRTYDLDELLGEKVSTQTNRARRARRPATSKRL